MSDNVSRYSYKLIAGVFLPTKYHLSALAENLTYIYPGL